MPAGPDAATRPPALTAQSPTPVGYTPQEVDACPSQTTPGSRPTHRATAPRTTRRVPRRTDPDLRPTGQAPSRTLARGPTAQRHDAPALVD